MPDVDGERFRGPAEGLRSRGRRGCGAVTAGFADKFGFDRELGTFVAPSSGYVVLWVLGGTAAAAVL